MSNMLLQDKKKSVFLLLREQEFHQFVFQFKYPHVIHCYWVFCLVSYRQLERKNTVLTTSSFQYIKILCTPWPKTLWKRKKYSTSKETQTSVYQLAVSSCSLKREVPSSDYWCSSSSSQSEKKKKNKQKNPIKHKQYIVFQSHKPVPGVNQS